MPDLPQVSADGWLTWGRQRWRCALGPAGIRTEKREGDGATPAGVFPLRRVLWRADRLPRPATGLDLAPIRPQDGWCDDPLDARYNQMVGLPYPASAERLWRDDAVYDVVVVIGYNDAPATPGRGSAIFLHVARPDYAPTRGCVALALADLLAFLAPCRPDIRVALGLDPGTAARL